MKASDLRIGNWVKIKEEFSERDIPLETLEFQIEGFNDGSNRYEEGAKQILFWSIKNKVFGTTTSGSYDIECEPILLTEEWLLKFGFKKRGRDDMPRTISYNLNDLFSIFPSNNFCDFAGYGFIWYKPDRDKSIESARFKFKYVHQLQNLYFTLTEEELTFEQD